MEKNVNARCDYLIDVWYRNLEENPGKPCLYDSVNTYNREEGEILSGKIYNYLLEQGIGKEDFVLIDMPRSSKIFLAMLGVNKAGAAFVVVERELGKERKAFIQKNINSKLVITEELFEKLSDVEYKKGYIKPDPHDAAFAIYTSGTTGVPKGIVHEFGQYDKVYLSIIRDTAKGTFTDSEDDRFLNIAPFNFVASIMVYALIPYGGGEIFTPGYDVIKNMKSLVEYIHQNKIKQAFFSPAILRVIGDKLNPEMEDVYTGGAPVSNLSINNGKLYNYYLMSETAFILSKRYVPEPLAVTPAGKPNEGIEVKLAEDGEVIAYNPYCRGYINDPDNPAFKDGYYYTGDIAEMNEDGEIIIKGRKSDMIKIDGNRVEPMEIELVASKLMGLPCIAKGFENGDNAYVCLYYVSENDVDKNEVVKKMEDYLPYYMIPAHFIRIDSLPMTSLGKIDRNNLPAPVIQSNAEYVEPTTDLQKKLCNAFKNALSGIDKIGIDDDLFELGLTSIGAIEAITHLEEENIQTADIYKNRTIRKIEESYIECRDAYMTPMEKELEGRKHSYPLDAVPTYMFFNQMRIPNNTSYNLAGGFKFSNLIDAEKLRDSINKYLDASSSYKVQFFLDENKMPRVKYNPDVFKPVEIEYMSEEEVEELRKTFVQPYNLLAEPPYRFRLVKTKKHSYLFSDVHHVMTDGTGMQLMAEDMINAFRGKPLAENNFFAYCYDLEKTKQSKFYQACIEKLDEQYLGKKWCGSPLDPGEEEFDVEEELYTKISARKIKKYAEKNNITRNTLLSAAYMLTLAKMHKDNNVLIAWQYSGRDANTNRAGQLLKIVYNGLRLDRKMDIKELYKAINKGIQEGIATSCAGYALVLGARRISLGELVMDDVEDLENFTKVNPLFKAVGEPIELERPNDNIGGESRGNAYFKVKNDGDKLVLMFRANNKLIQRRTVLEFLNNMNEALTRLMAGDESVITDFIN